jgi:hypothetical protein
MVAILVRHDRRQHRWTDSVVTSLLLTVGLVVGVLIEPVVRTLLGAS